MTFLTIVGVMILMIALGKKKGKMGTGLRVTIAVMVVIQLCLILFDIYTKRPPA